MGKSNKRRSTRQRHRRYSYARDRRKLRSPRVAVLLNRNARKVNALMINRIRRQAPHADIFVTGNLAEAEEALQTVANGRYDLCFTGGGMGQSVTQSLDSMSSASTKMLPQSVCFRLGPEMPSHRF